MLRCGNCGAIGWYVSIKTYSPYLDKYLQDGHNQFTLPYKNVGLTTAIQAVNGVVKSAESCGTVKGASVSIPTGTETTSADGRFSVSATGPARYPVDVRYSGYGTAPNTYGSVVAGQPSPMKLMMATSGVLKGKVTLNGSGVAGAKLSLSGGLLRTTQSLKANADGTFNFGSTAIGNYKVSATLSGLPTRTVATSIARGKTTSVVVELRK